MSTAETAVPAAPEVAAPAPEAPVEATPAVTESAADMLRDLRTARFDAPHHSQTQPRDEAGKFDGPPEGEAAAKPEGEAAATKPAAETPQPGSSGPTEAASPPEGMVRIELPEGHPLREQGVQHIDAPAGQERHYRALVNGSVRRSEVEAAQTRERQLQEQLIDLQAQVKALSEGMDGPDAEVLEVQADIAKLREAGLNKQADLMLEGLKARQRHKAEGYRSELSAEQQKVQAQEAGMRFIQDAESAAQYVFKDSGWEPPTMAALETYARTKPADEPPTIEGFMGVLQREYYHAVGTGKLKVAPKVDAAPAPATEPSEVAALKQQVDALQTQLSQLTRRATNPLGELPTGTPNSTSGNEPENAASIVRQARSRQLGVV